MVEISIQNIKSLKANSAICGIIISSLTHEVGLHIADDTIVNCVSDFDVVFDPKTNPSKTLLIVMYHRE